VVPAPGILSAVTTDPGASAVRLGALREAALAQEERAGVRRHPY
jgi:hypothetical protein